MAIWGSAAGLKRAAAHQAMLSGTGGCYARPSTLESDLSCEMCSPRRVVKHPAWDRSTFKSLPGVGTRRHALRVSLVACNAGLSLDNAGKLMKPLTLVHASSSQWPWGAGGHGFASKTCHIQRHGRVSGGASRSFTSSHQTRAVVTMAPGQRSRIPRQRLHGANWGACGFMVLGGACAGGRQSMSVLESLNQASLSPRTVRL